MVARKDARRSWWASRAIGALLIPFKLRAEICP